MGVCCTTNEQHELAGTCIKYISKSTKSGRKTLKEDYSSAQLHLL